MCLRMMIDHSEVYYIINNYRVKKHSLKQLEMNETGFWGQKKKGKVMVLQ